MPKPLRIPYSQGSSFWIVILLLSLQAIARAQFTFTTNNGAITITGYSGSGGVVVIPAATNGYPVTGVGSLVFAGKAVTSVTFPVSLTNIGSGVCDTCASLTNVIFSNCAASTGMSAFFHSGLVTVAFGNSLTAIDGSAFQGCTALKNVVMPDSVKNVAGSAFYGCTSLTNATLGNGVTNLDSQVFSGCTSLATVTLGNSLVTIGGGAFYNTVLTSLNVPDSVTNLSGAFSGCKYLRSLIIGKGLAAITAFAFSDCYSLTNLVMGTNITAIQSGAFSNCVVLTQLSLPNSVVNIQDGAFAFCHNLTSLALPNAVTNIGANAFSHVWLLTSLTIPKTVIHLGGNAFSPPDMPGTILTNIYFAGNAPPDDGTAFTSQTRSTVYYLPGTTGWGATFGSRPTALWNPRAVSPQVSAGQFASNLAGPTNTTIIVEACTNLGNPLWLPVGTNTFSANGTATFSDPQSSNFPRRFYRFRGP